MTNAELIQTIRAEIERLKETNPCEYNYQNAEGYVWALYDILSFLSALEKSEKPINPKANAKFKEGDWIKSKRHGKVAQVIMLLRDCYSLKTLDNDGLWLDYNFQDTWELIKEPSEKPMNLDEEIAIYLNRELLNRIKNDDTIDGFTTFDAGEIACYFYDLGCRRTAEKFDEIEYNRQRAEEEIPNDKVVEGEVILNGHGLLADVTKWGDGYKLKIIIRED